MVEYISMTETGDNFTEEQKAELNLIGFNDEDLAFILDIYVNNQGKDVIEAYNYLIEESQKGEPVENIVAGVELENGLETLKSQNGFTDSDVEFIYEIYGNDKMKILRAIDDDLMRFLSRGQDKDEAMLNLVRLNLIEKRFTPRNIDQIMNIYKTSELIKDAYRIILERLDSGRSPSEITESILASPAASAAGGRRRRTRRNKRSKRRSIKSKTKKRSTRRSK
jgi:hypothetical protein